MSLDDFAREHGHRQLAKNAGATWFYDATRRMNDAERMAARCLVSDPGEHSGLGLTNLISLAATAHR